MLTFISATVELKIQDADESFMIDLTGGECWKYVHYFSSRFRLHPSVLITHNFVVN